MHQNYMGIHHAEILVTDIAKALDFYTNVLGLHEIHNHSTFTNSKWLAIGNQELHLTYHPESDAHEHRHIAIQIKNLSKFKEELSLKNITIKDAVPIGGRERIFIFDPFGNRIEFLQLN